MLGRMLRSADFEVVLGSPARVRSAHFAAHYVQQPPSQLKRRCWSVWNHELSTDDPEGFTQPVDDNAQPTLDRCWYGAVVPKRHARKATTRNLLKRQIREAMRRHQEQLPYGLWLVRLRVPFDARQFRSAGSRLLSAAARDELDRLLARATV
jgi:ribonuclease P protein component